MKYSILLLLLFPFTLFGQLNGTLSTDVYACTGTSAQSLTFTGSNGTAPYTFYYNINGGATQTITTVSGNSVSLSVSTGSVGTFNYNLTQVDDNIGASASISDQAIATIYALPNVNAGLDQTICAGGTVILNGTGASSYSWTNGVFNGVAFSPASTATYTLTGVSAQGCVNTDQVVVTVNPLPTVGAGSDQTVCAGNSVTLTASGATTYTWNVGVTNGVAFIPPSTGTYTVNGTSATGCTNYDQVLVTVNPLPIVNAGPDQTICNGNSTVLTGSGATIYSWSPPTGLSSTTAASPNASPVSTTTYTLTGTSSQGCVNTDQVVVNVGATLNVNAGNDTVVCYANFFTLTATGGTTYTWDNGVQNGVPTQALIPGTTVYTVNSTSGACSGSDQVVVYVPPIPNVSAGNDVSVCVGSSIILTGTGAITYIWDQGVIDGTPFTPPLGTNIYAVTGYSPEGCSNSDAVTVTVVALPTDPGAVIDSAGCNNGAIQIIQSGQTTNYSYNWMTGATTSGISNLAAGPYEVAIYDNSTGCYANFTYEVPQSLIPQNCAELSGFVYFDADENCAINTGDTPQANRMIVANPGNYLAVTDPNGFYSMNLPLGTYTVEEIFNYPGFGNYCNLSYTVPLLNNTDSIGDNNFLDTLLGDVDFQANIYMNAVMPGFSFMVYPSFYSLTATGSLSGTNAWIKIPNGVTLQSWAYPFTISNDTIYFVLNTSTSFMSTLNFMADVSLTLGSPIPFCAGVENYPGEIITANNTTCSTTNVIGSFDPNDKTMFLNGVQSDSTIFLTDQTLDYVIRFQNTGTAPAQDIYILDTISATLDLNSFEYVTASHSCTVSILEDNVLKFSFPQIFLPDSTNNEPESHGFIHYRIRQSNQNTLGTVINNTAYIYFDFNEAVVTNTTFDEIVIDDLGMEEEQIDNLKIYPNPTSGKLNIFCDQRIKEVKVLSTNGQLISERQVNENSTKLDLNELTVGVYFIEVYSESGKVVKRIIVQ